MTFNFFTQKPEMSKMNPSKVLTLGDSDYKSTNIFLYESIHLNQLISAKFEDSDYLNADALFIYPEHFQDVSSGEYRTSIKKIAHNMPVIFINADEFKSILLFNTDLDYEKIRADSGYNEKVQSFYTFPNEEFVSFRADSFKNDTKEQLNTAIQTMKLSKTVEDYQNQMSSNN